jgi:hypothetical protein
MASSSPPTRTGRLAWSSRRSRVGFSPPLVRFVGAMQRFRVITGDAHDHQVLKRIRPAKTAIDDVATVIVRAIREDTVTHMTDSAVALPDRPTKGTAHASMRRPAGKSGVFTFPGTVAGERAELRSSRLRGSHQDRLATAQATDAHLLRLPAIRAGAGPEAMASTVLLAEHNVIRPTAPIAGARERGASGGLIGITSVVAGARTILADSARGHTELRAAACTDTGTTVRLGSWHRDLQYRSGCQRASGGCCRAGASSCLHSTKKAQPWNDTQDDGSKLYVFSNGLVIASKDGKVGIVVKATE